jgi:DNA polymerase-3 subunit gamma/tau
VGKTTTARILARALNCANGPTPDPCGVCDACVEIAEGRDIDVLEIDAATHTGVDNVREVIITGLAIVPVRNRYKVYIIDEVHQLSIPAFNALLKSIEEPPPHVVFMMATTQLDKIPETVLSRSQVYEFRTISTKMIADQLRRIASAEQISVGDGSLQLIARDAEGSMRDAQGKLDQVMAFTGTTITGEDVATVLGLVGRDLLLDTIQAVADENAPEAFALAARAVEMGYDLRAVCRELSRVVRDLLVLTVDPTRISDPEIVGAGERDRLPALAALFSREDLLRAFDLLARVEGEIRGAAQPRYHLEMGLLRWMHLRKLVPIEDLIQAAGTQPSSSRAPAAGSGPRSVPVKTTSARPAPSGVPGTESSAARRPQGAAPPVVFPAASSPVPAAERAPASGVKDALLAEIRRTKVVFYNTVVAQAQKIEVTPAGVVFTFSPAQRALLHHFEQTRSWLESVAQQVGGRRLTVTGVLGGAEAVAPAAVSAADSGASKQSALREQALANESVQAMLEVFPAEIRDVEEI